jgi:uncharacterized protein (DUF1697 family)
VKTYVSLLRGINVSAQKRIKMEELRSLYAALGFRNVQTYIQSGNVVFQSQNPDAVELSRNIEASIEGHFGYSVSVVMRRRSDLHRILDHNPFLRDRDEDITKLCVVFLAASPDPSALNEISTVKDPYDEFQVMGREIYLFCPHGFARTKLSNNFFERKLKVSATTRNWKTVNKLYEMTDTDHLTSS